MRIFINALSARLGGGQTYLSNLLQHVPQNENVKIFVLVQPSFKLEGLPKNVERIEKTYLENPFLRAIWEEIFLSSILKKLEIDLFFSPGGLLPRSLPSNLLKVVTFQNMLPFDHGQRMKYPFGYRYLRDYLLEFGLASAMRRADLVIFISEFAQKFIKQKLGALKGQSIIVPHGIQASFKFCMDKLLPKPSWVPTGDYFLYVSFIDRYKAQLELVRGFSLYLQQGGLEKLVLVGAEYPPYANLVREEIVKLGLTDWVYMIGNKPHSELPAAYQNARINLFASRVENCPNILLEMMASRRPALVSNRDPMPEFGGDSVAYFDPDSPENIAQEISVLTHDPGRQETLSSQAFEKAAMYTWEYSSEKTWGAICALARKAQVLCN